MTASIYKAYALFMFYHLSRVVDKTFGINIHIYPCEDDKNTVIAIDFNSDGKNDFEIHQSKSLAECLVAAKVEHVFSHLDGIDIEGTYTYIGSDNIVYIKENKIEHFSDDAVRENVLTLVKHRLGIA